MIAPRAHILLAGMLALAALGGSVALNVQQAGAIHGHKVCFAAVSPGARTGADPRKLCPPVIAARWSRAVQAETCDAALGERPENRYGVANNCSAPVRRLQAQRDAAVQERDGVTRELDILRAGQVAAIRRAEAAARTQAERKARAALVVQSAPRDPAGLVICDAGCLRARGGAEGGSAPR